jgi:hypothetical protein
MKNPVSQRTVLSPFLLVLFLTLSVTGLLMLLHIRNGAIVTAHEWTGLVFIIAGLIHFILNFRQFLSYFRQPGPTSRCWSAP